MAVQTERTIVRRTAECDIAYAVQGAPGRAVTWGHGRGGTYVPDTVVVHFGSTDSDPGKVMDMPFIAARVRGKILRKDGTPGLREHWEYFSSERPDTPDWVRDLIKRAEGEMSGDAQA